MDSLFGEGTSLPVRFFIAFVVVFALIGVTAWLIRRFGSGALGGTNTRGRAPRLAVIEAGAVDGRRKLVLIRRDNIEHLIMIGGPTDIVVEANIVRGQSARDNAVQRGSSGTEPTTRALPVADDSWPLQPEPAARPTRATRPAPLEDAAQWSLQPEQTPPSPAPKRSRSADTLAGLAAELSVRPSEPSSPTSRPAPAIDSQRPPRPAPAPPSADQNLADMAQRLEAALRRPTPSSASPAAPRPGMSQPPAPKPITEAPRVAPPITPPAAPPKAPDSAAPVTDPDKSADAPAPAPANAAKPDKPDKPDDALGSLEEEMANLLGRPAGKPS